MKKSNTILLCLMITIILGACNQKQSNSEGENNTLEQSDQGENDASANKDKRMYISELQLTDDEKDIWDLFTSDSDSNIYSYTTDDQIKSVSLKCYRLNKDDDFNWFQIGNVNTNVDDSKGLIVFRINDDIEMVSKNGGTKGLCDLTYSEYLPDGGSASSYIWQSEANITYDDEIPLGMLVSVTINEDRFIQPRILNDFYEPENLEEYDNVIAFTACFSTSEKSEP
ncbi:MAG: hypothetical protein ACRC3H_11605 [Lachnospiraceae bacterium]